MRSWEIGEKDWIDKLIRIWDERVCLEDFGRSQREGGTNKWMDG